MNQKRLLGLAIGSYAAMVIFSALETGVFSFTVSPQRAMFLAIANFGANIATDAIL